MICVSLLCSSLSSSLFSFDSSFNFLEVSKSITMLEGGAFPSFPPLSFSSPPILLLVSLTVKFPSPVQLLVFPPLLIVSVGFAIV